MFLVTADLYIGRFASLERLKELQTLNITEIINVSDTPNQLATQDGPFRSVTWHSIEDGTLIPTKTAIATLDTIHNAIASESGRVYVHCMAGWNRSPTIAWLYLLACGFHRELASRAICANAYDAVPGHQRLVDSKLIDAVMKHGNSNYMPHPRPSALKIEPMV